MVKEQVTFLLSTSIEGWPEGGNFLGRKNLGQIATEDYIGLLWQALHECPGLVTNGNFKFSSYEDSTC